MNLLEVLAIFVLLQETLCASRIVVKENSVYVPLAVIKKRYSPELELATPQKSDRYGEYAYYSHNNSEDNNGPVEKFMYACPPRSNVNQYLLDDFATSGKTCLWGAYPSIEKAKKNSNDDVEYCGQSNAEIYNVGFPVSKIDGTDNQFMFIYKICYSTTNDKGMMYSIHRIHSPSLLLQEAWEHYKPIPETLHECSLSKKDDIERLFSEENYTYQFVGMEDMPTKLWEATTQFGFNYTPISLNEDLIKGMIKADNYIRLYSKETNKPLTLYSGVLQTVVNIEPKSVSCASILCKAPKSVPVHTFWRIIKDDDGRAIVILTQHSEMKCDAETYICNENSFLVKEYKNGGCTYMCLATRDIIYRLGLPFNAVMERLQLPSLEIIGELALTFPRNLRSDSLLEESSDIVEEKPPELVTIFDFFKKETLREALEYADPHLASIVYIHELSTKNDGE